MPQITRSYKTSFQNIDNFYDEVKSSFIEIGGTDIKEESIENLKTISGVVPSIWGWGGMTINVSLKKINETMEMTISGYIAQLATGPLSDIMNKILNSVSEKIKAKYNAVFEVNTNSKDIESNIKLTGTDTKMLTSVLIASFIYVFGGFIFGGKFATVVSALILGLGYYFGSKYLHKK